MKRINITIPDELEQEINNYRGELTPPKFIKQSLDFIINLYKQGYVIHNGELLEKATSFEINTQKPMPKFKELKSLVIKEIVKNDEDKNHENKIKDDTFLT